MGLIVAVNLYRTVITLSPFLQLVRRRSTCRRNLPGAMVRPEPQLTPATRRDGNNEHMRGEITENRARRRVVHGTGRLCGRDELRCAISRERGEHKLPRYSNRPQQPPVTANSASKELIHRRPEDRLAADRDAGREQRRGAPSGGHWGGGSVLGREM
jgi:hypothetical protein